MRWLGYLAKKFFYLICSLFAIASLTFILMKAVPGDPFSEEQAMRTDVHEALLRHHGMDKTWGEQYGDYLSSLVHGHLGYSLKHQGRSVNAIIAEGFPVSALLGIEAFSLALIGGLSLGTFAAYRAGTFFDYLILFLIMIGVSIPSFIIATLLQYIFALQLDFFPIARWGTFSHTVLPAIALASLPLAFIARMTRASLLEVLQMDYIKTARAKGLSNLTILRRHALPNALLPVLSYLGQLLAAILIGSFVIEKIFSIPGLGQWLINSVSNRDYPLIMGLTLFYSIILMVAIFLVDIAYSLLDPRISVLKKDP
jgi:oligopeptide transport system permease protein